MNVRTDREAIPTRDHLLPQPIDDEREAFEELFSRCRIRLYNTALRLLKNHGDAEDALQDGVLSAFRNLSGFEGRSQTSTWLTRIVINAALMHRRQRRSNLIVPMDQSLGQDEQPLAGRIPDPLPDPEEMYARQEQLQVVKRTLQTMPEVNLRAWWLRHVQGLTIKEVAEIIGVPEGTLKSQFCRARRRLRKEAAETGQTQEALHCSRAWRS